MKFSLFAHMERYQPSTSHRQLFEQLTSLVKIAEEGGFETAWIGEHHGMEFTIAPNPFINIAYLAARTERIRLGTGTVVAPFWHPIKLAGEAAMTDIITGGRLDIGVARGAYSFEYARLADGIDAMAAGAKLRELVPTLRKLWDGDYAHEGEYWNFPATTCTPRPLQKPYPPLWIAARDPHSHAFAVANGCNVQVTPLWSGDDEVESLMGRFNDACAANPDVPRPRIMLLMHTHVAASETQVEQASRDLSRFYGLFATWFRNEKPVRQGFIEAPDDEELAAMSMYAPDVLREALVIGTPDTVIERLRRYEALGYDQYSFWIDNGMSFEAKRQSLQLFIDKVMPAFA
jgi:alkanesulfonate monooxygenase SsuD/methylene tetrahydromethanopterin reductase-like flavin-dependent oxidoreductase (luciferase family)